MDKATEKVLAGFTKLSKEQQSEFMSEINSFVKKEFSEQRIFSKSLHERIVSGPYGSEKCPCCGR